MGPPQATTSRGTRGGVRYFGDDDSDREEAKEFKVESKHSTSAKQVPETKTSPGAPSTKQVSRTSASKSIVIPMYLVLLLSENLEGGHCD